MACVLAPPVAASSSSPAAESSNGTKKPEGSAFVAVECRGWPPSLPVRARWLSCRPRRGRRGAGGRRELWRDITTAVRCSFARDKTLDPQGVPRSFALSGDCRPSGSVPSSGTRLPACPHTSCVGCVVLEKNPESKDHNVSDKFVCFVFQSCTCFQVGPAMCVREMTLTETQDEGMLSACRARCSSKQFTGKLNRAHNPAA